VARTDPLAPFSAPTRAWFGEAFAEPTRAQVLGWAAISAGDGAPALYVERGGRGLVTLPALADEELVPLVLAALPRLLAPSGPLKELRLERVDRAPPAESALADGLRGLGFRPSYRAWLLRA